VPETDPELGVTVTVKLTSVPLAANTGLPGVCPEIAVVVVVTVPVFVAVSVSNPVLEAAGVSPSTSDTGPVPLAEGVKLAVTVHELPTATDVAPSAHPFAPEDAT